MSNLIREARDARGWTSARLNLELRRAASQLRVTTASEASLRVMISRWENDKEIPDASYRLLLQKAFNLPAATLGFERDGVTEVSGVPLTALVQRGSSRLRLSDNTLNYFRNQFVEHVRMDNLVGPGLVIDTVSIQYRQLRVLAERGPAETMQLAARFAELAGWLHQDSGDPSSALKYTDESVDLAEAADDVGLAAYTTMRKSNVLSATGDHHRASLTAGRALTLAEKNAPHLMAVCLRQAALTHAYLGHETTTRAALDQALELTTPVVEPNNELSPYCTTSYVQMEGALCSLVLGQPASAVEACTDALAAWPVEIVRDKALCLARLAIGQLDLYQLDEACESAMLAIEHVQASPSARTLHMLQLIGRRVLPLKQARAVRQFRQALAAVA